MGSTIAALAPNLPPMNLNGLLSITGKPGLYRMTGNRKGGLLVEPIAGGRREFVTQRGHQFTPLESIAIYTDDGESVPLKDVLARMQEQADDNPPPDPKSASKEDLREYLLDVLPRHDQERVYVSDIKKLVRWYGLLDEAGLLEEEEPPAEQPTPEEQPAAEERPTVAEEPATSADAGGEAKA